jgi:hypothetical protein
MFQNHDYDVDRKDSVINMLDRELDICDDQLQTVVGRHAEAIDQILQTQVTNCKLMEEVRNLTSLCKLLNHLLAS